MSFVSMATTINYDVKWKKRERCGKYPVKAAKKNSNPQLLQLLQVLHEDYFINLVLLNWRKNEDLII